MARVKMTDDRLKQLGITMEDVEKYRRHVSTIRRCGRDGGSKYKSVVGNDEYEEAARWKRDNEAREAKKRKRSEKRKAPATVSNKRKGQPEVEGDASPDYSGRQKKRKADAKKQGKAKVVLSDSSGGDDQGWKPSESDHQEEDSGGEDKRRGKLYKKLKKVHKRPNVVPEATSKFNQTKLEDYDIRLVGRSLCKMSTIRMDSFEEDFPFGISDILTPFRGLLELSLPYSDSVVKVFYSNLKLSRGAWFLQL